MNNSKWVKNMSDRELTFNEISVLSKGLNFAVTQEIPPIVKLITSSESVHANLDESIAEELRHNFITELSQKKAATAGAPRLLHVSSPATFS